jgi:hypothetical protein
VQIGPQSPKTEFGAQHQYGRVIYPSIRNVTWSKKNILLGVKKAKIGRQSPKTEFGVQHQYGRVIYPSIGNFTWSKKNCTFGGQKGKNKVGKINETQAPKSQNKFPH